MDSEEVIYTECVVCGEQLTGAQTKFCSSKCTSKWHQQHNPLKQRQYQRKWRESHREKVNELARAWRAQNKDKVRESRRKTYQKHKDKIKTRVKEYRKEYLQRPEVKEMARGYDRKTRLKKKLAQGALHQCKGKTDRGDRCSFQLRGAEDFCRWHAHQAEGGHYFDKESRNRRRLIQCKHTMADGHCCRRLVSKAEGYCWQHIKTTRMSGRPRQLNCSICGKPIGSGRTKYCSDQCSAAGQRINMNSPKQRAYSSNLQQEKRLAVGLSRHKLLRCAICSKRLTGRQRKFCSPECSGKSYQLK